MKDKGFFITFIIYVILLIGDITTTFMNGELVQYLEINPLFMLTKSFIPIIVLNCLVLFAFVWTYKTKNTSPTSRFIVINTMITVIMVRIIAIRNALRWLNNPITVEAAKAIPTEIKVEAVKQLAIISYAPVFMALIIYLVWRCDHHVQIK